jgi:hypothetical protein
VAVTVAAAAVGVTGGLLVARNGDEPPASVDSKTEVRSTLPPATENAPIPGSTPTSTSTSTSTTSTTAPVTPSAGP